MASNKSENARIAARATDAGLTFTRGKPSAGIFHKLTEAKPGDTDRINPRSRIIFASRSLEAIDAFLQGVEYGFDDASIAGMPSQYKRAVTPGTLANALRDLPYA